MRRILIPLSILAGLALLVWVLVRDGADEGDRASQDPGAGTADSGSAGSLEETLIRDRVAAMAARTMFGQARKALAPLVEGEDAAFDDLITATVIELKQGDLATARGFLDRARALDADAAVIHYLDGRMAEVDLDRLHLAPEFYRAALERAPDDMPSKYALAQVLANSFEEADNAEALKLFAELEAVGREFGGPWWVSAVYQLFQTHQFLGEDLEAERRYENLWNSLQLLGLRAVTGAELDEGELARITPPPAIGNRADAPVVPPTYAAAELIAPELAGAGELLAVDLDGDLHVDLVGAGPTGLVIVTRTMDGGWHPARHVTTEPTRSVRAIDLHQDDSLDLVCVVGTQLALFECEGEFGAEQWRPTPLALPQLPSPPTDIEPVDFDHDGDLDLLLAGDFGGRLLRNDGAGIMRQGDQELPRGEFVLLDEGTGLPEDAGWTWCAIEDFDGDGDIDLLLGGPGKAFLGASARTGHFEDLSLRLPEGLDLAAEPLWLDADGDARTDLLTRGEPAILCLQERQGAFAARELGVAIPAEGALIEVDVDLDGTLDALWPEEDSVAAGLLALGLPQEQGARLAPAAPGGALVVTDLESGPADALAWELLRREADGVRVYRAEEVAGNGIRIHFKGKKDNRQGIGAVIELRAGPVYRRHLWRGGSTLYGIAGAELAEIVRITWPNGVVQNSVDVDQGNQVLTTDDKGIWEQTDGLVGSCPFLYTWNGETFEFISDVLGITPLGLPMAPGLLVPPDHDEYVLVHGEQLVPKEGRYVLQFTEELREVTYLDRARLDVVDHPLGSELQPNERFTFPPFPEARAHVLEELLPPLRATGSDGADWTGELARVDDVHALPFECLEQSQFLGLAEPHWLELEFDPAAIEGAQELRLACTGWFYWTDASVNMAAARTPGIEFVPPIVEVPAGNGGAEWRPIGPPVGFPAGKTKTMVIDLTGVLDPADPRVRIGSTLRLYWDSIRLAVGPDGPSRTTSLEPVSARLWPRGFSRPLAGDKSELPERFEWDEKTSHGRWNQHPGLYTRFGEVTPLVMAIDDRFVVMGSGDALALEFDAGDLPPLPEGWRRDFLVFLDGWAKDRDPNTVEALAVEPLPFHGMSGYPYGADEHFPDTPEHRAWREEWQTRPAFQHVVPLSPAREAEWEAATSVLDR